MPIDDRFLRQTFCIARRPDVVETSHARDLRTFLFEHLGAVLQHSQLT